MNRSDVTNRLDDVTYRAMDSSDFDAVYRVLASHDTEVYGASVYTIEDLYVDWKPTERFSVGNNVHVAVADGGHIVGYVAVLEFRDPPVRPYIWGTVLSAWRGRGIGSQLMRWALDRSRHVVARVPAEARVVAHSTVQHTDESAARLMRRHGLVHTLSSYHMQIDFDGPPEKAVLPEGFRIVSYADVPDIKLWAYVYGHSFADHRGWHIHWTVEQARSRVDDLLAWPTTDPNTLFLLMDGNLPVGIVTVHPDSEQDADLAYTHWLAVMPGYRRKGLARQLLQHAFCTAYAMGKPGHTLNVDGSSLTGAVRLYERAGMHIANQYDSYEIELRPGIEYTRQ